MNNGTATFAIDGTFYVDQTLTAILIEDDPDGNGIFYYEWYAIESTYFLDGALFSSRTIGTSSSLMLSPMDAGTEISLRVEYIDSQGYRESIYIYGGLVPKANFAGTGGSNLLGTLRADYYTGSGTNNSFDGLDGYDRAYRSGDLSNYTISGSPGNGGTALIESITGVKNGKNAGTVTLLDSLRNIEWIQIIDGDTSSTINAGGVNANGILRTPFSGTFLAHGGAGVDTITGGSFRNWLAGRGFAAGMTRGVETITGTTNTEGRAQDAFDLLDESLARPAYVGGGTFDYARIENFNQGIDKIILTGGVMDYSFSFTQILGGRKTAVTDEYWAISTASGDLIAQVRGSISSASISPDLFYYNGDKAIFFKAIENFEFSF